MPTPRPSRSSRRRLAARRVYGESSTERPEWIHEELLRPGQVAVLFQVSRRTISQWARSGKLESILTPGGHRRFPIKQVRALLDAQRIEPPG